MDCTKHQIHQEFSEDCPECMREEQDTEDNAHARSMDMLSEQEQVSGTDVLPSDCSGCPLYGAKEHKGDTVPVSRVDRLFLRYLLWQEVYHNGYTVQIGEILGRLFPNEKVVPRN